MARAVVLGLVAAAWGCGGGDAPATAGSARAAAPTALASAATASTPPSGSPSAAPTAGASGAAASGSASAGGSAAPASSAAGGPPAQACGAPAVQLAFTGPALLVEEKGDVKVVFDDGGVARVVAPAAVPAKGTRLALDGTAKKATAPACVRAGDKYVCADTQGALHRAAEEGHGDKVIAQARPGAPISAATLGAHVLVAFLGDRRTTEGAVTLAFGALDDQTPVLISEEGSGATYVALAPLGERAIAAYVDARRAMTPVHAREVRVGADGKLALGKDAVAFVGEGADARTPCALVPSAAGALALVPVGDGAKFGMAAVQLGAPPVDDAPVSWSAYPNGCTPAPLAATKEFPAKVARVRPVAREPGSRRALELGDVDAAGTFTPICAVAEAGSFTDVAVARDGQSTVWIAFTDGDGTWLVRHGTAAPAAPRKR